VVVCTLKINRLCVYGLGSAWYHSGAHQCHNVALLTAVCTLLFTAAGSAKIVETEHKSVQVGSMTKQQGVYAAVRTKVSWLVWLSSAVMLVLLASSNNNHLVRFCGSKHILCLF